MPHTQPTPERVAAFEWILRLGFDALTTEFLDYPTEGEADFLCICMGGLYAVVLVGRSEIAKATMARASRGMTDEQRIQFRNAAMAARMVKTLATDAGKSGEAFADFLNGVDLIRPRDPDKGWPQAHWRLNLFMELTWRALRACGGAQEDVDFLVPLLAEALILCEGDAFIDFLGTGRPPSERKQIAAMVPAIAAFATREYAARRQAPR